MPKKTWREKMEREHEIVTVKGKMAGRFGTKEGDSLLIPSPKDIDALMKSVKKGKLVTSDQIRERLARDYDTDSTCPLVTGIFIRVAAEAAEEESAEGKKRTTPYWRTVKPGGKLNPKLPGGAEAQAKRLKAEGHTMLLNRAKMPVKVQDFGKHLQTL